MTSSGRRSTTNHPSDYFYNSQRRRSSGNSQQTTDDEDFDSSHLTGDVVDGNVSMKSTKVKQLSKKLERSIIIPSYSHRVGSKPIQRSFERGVSGDYEEETSIVADARDVVRDRSTLGSSTGTLHENPNEVSDRGCFLKSHRFGSIYEDEDEDAEAAIESLQRPRARSHLVAAEERLFVSDDREDDEDDAWGSEFDSDSCDSIDGFFMPLCDTRARACDVVDFEICYEPQNSIDVDAEDGIDDVADYVWNTNKHPPPKMPPCPNGLSKVEQKQRHIVEEIIQTENSYVEILRILSEEYDQTLKNHNPSIISKEDREVIFCRISKLLELHRSFQISLEDVAANWDECQQIGNVFVARFSSSNVRRVYSRYVINYSNAIDRVNNLKDSRRFAAFLAQKKQTSKTKLSIDQLLSRPFQKFPQYILLLEQLIKNTPEGHHDYYSLQQALSNIISLASYLNDKKAESEQRIEARNVMRALKRQFCMMDQRQHLKLINRITVKSLCYSFNGTLSSRKTQELFLFNMMLMCCSKNVSGELKLEWAEQLHKIKIKQDSVTPDMKYVVRKDSLGQIMIRSHHANFRANATGTARCRMEELQSLIHDQTVLKQINTLASTLRYKYSNLEIHNLLSISSRLDKLIQQKTDENRLMDSSQLILQVNTARDEEDGETYVFELASSKTRNEWIEQFMQARLSQDIWNQDSWYLRDASAISSNPMAHQPNGPLLISGMTADLSRNLGEVNCAVPVCLVYGNILKRHLWCCHANAGVTILSIYNHTPKILQNFRCDTHGDDLSFWCVEVVPGQMEATEERYQADMVWIGTSINQILIYTLLEEERSRPMCTIETESPVVSLCFCEDRVYAGLLNGCIHHYARDDSGCWLTGDPIEIGHNPVVKIAKIPNRKAILAACENKLVRIDFDEGRFIVDPLELDPPQDMDPESLGHVQDFAVSEVTAWVAFQRSLTVQLVYLKTHKSIQSVSLKRTLDSLKIKSGHKSVEEDEITCINVVKEYLLIGTRSGFICKVLVAKQKSSMLQSNSPCAVSVHKHKASVRFITAFHNVIEKLIPSMDIKVEIDPDAKSLFLEDKSAQRTLTSDQNEDSGTHASRATTEQIAEDVNTKIPRRQVSMIPVTDQWLSTPNLLLSRQIKESPPLPINKVYEKLSAVCESEENVSALSCSPFRKLSSEFIGPPSCDPIKRPTGVKPTAECERDRILMEGTLFVTGGLGYEDIENRCQEVSEDEAAIMCWCVK